MPSENESAERKYLGPSGQDMNETKPTPVVSPDDPAYVDPNLLGRPNAGEENPSDSTSEEQETDNGLSPLEIRDAFGINLVGNMNPEVFERLKNAPRDSKEFKSVQVVLNWRSSKYPGMTVGQILDEQKFGNDPEFKAVVKRLKSAFGIFDEDNSPEQAPKSPESAGGQPPEGLQSTDELVNESKWKTAARRLAKSSFLKNAEDRADMIRLAAGSPIYTMQQALIKLHIWNGDRTAKFMDKYNKMTPEERKKQERRGNAVLATVMGGMALYAFSRVGGVDWSSGGGNNNALADGMNDYNGPSGGNRLDETTSPVGDAPMSGNHSEGTSNPDNWWGSDDKPAGDRPHDLNDLPQTDAAHEGFGNYDPNLDPARSPLKSGNDWGPALQGSPEDAGRPSGTGQFFEHNIKQSPKEFSATLAEFGLNDKGKNATAINELAEQMRTDPKLAQEKYDLLMKKIGSAKIYEITYDGDYGSYYAVSNPDGTVSLSYDEIVAGKRGNRFIVFEVDGVKHYGHPECGMQWSHFNPDKPVEVEQPSYSSSAPPPRSSNPNPPIYNNPPRTPQPPIDNPPPNNPPPPPQEPPIDNPPVIPPVPPEVKGDTRGEFLPQGPGEFEANGPNFTAPSTVARPAQNGGGNIIDSFISSNPLGETGTVRPGGVSNPSISGPVGSSGGSSPESGSVASP